VRRVGWDQVHASVTAIGWWYVAVIALAGARFATRAGAWQACAASDGLPLRRAFAATLAGDTLGNLTPFGMLASEPTKVWFVHDRLPTVAAVGSVAAENAFYTASVILMIAVGAVTFFNLANVPPPLQVAAQIIIAAALVGGISAVWVARHQPAILSRLAGGFARLTGRAATAPDRLREIEVHFYALLKWPMRRILQIAAWEGLFHVLAVAEVFLILRLLVGAREVSLVDAFVLETTGRLITVLFKFIPYRLGVDEAGSAVVASAMAFDPAAGVALALVRRLRILFWNAVGLVLLATRRGVVSKSV
jgi:hypothetical protein